MKFGIADTIIPVWIPKPNYVSVVADDQRQ